jgi:hypothetical protein
LLRKPVEGGAYELVKEFRFGGDEPQDGSLFNYAA